MLLGYVACLSKLSPVDILLSLYNERKLRLMRHCHACGGHPLLRLGRFAHTSHESALVFLAYIHVYSDRPIGPRYLMSVLNIKLLLLLDDSVVIALRTDVMGTLSPLNTVASI